ncbi:hypothetical protein Bbelb_112650 [Branchiostoma belcheri]|nr:hypothetical protein Bbelb_112650 [Branchiostoma belcheri]
MVQEFHVIRCFSCETFQVHQVKKSNKWNCKLCGAKQSVRKEYGRGSGADCRRHVQKLNMMRATQDSAPPASDDLEVSQQEWQESTEDSTDPQCDYTDDGRKPSKWEKFVASTATDKTDDNQDPSDSEDPQFTTDKNRFQQRKRKGKGQRVQYRMYLPGHHLSRHVLQTGSLLQLNKRILQCFMTKEGDVNTRMTGDVQNCEVSELRTGFCTGEDLDEVLGDDIWDLGRQQSASSTGLHTAPPGGPIQWVNTGKAALSNVFLHTLCPEKTWVVLCWRSSRPSGVLQEFLGSLLAVSFKNCSLCRHPLVILNSLVSNWSRCAPKRLRVIAGGAKL